MTQHTARHNAEPITNISSAAQTRSRLEWACTQWFWARDHQTWSHGLRELAALRATALRCGWIEMIRLPPGSGRNRRQVRLTADGFAVLALLQSKERDDA